MNHIIHDHKTANREGRGPASRHPAGAGAANLRCDHHPFADGLNDSNPAAQDKESTMTSKRAWIMFRSGRRINLLDPHPGSWTDADLAIGLSRTYRWGGHSAWELPLSVAQHSLTVLAIRMKLAERPLTAAECLRELLHDATEALIGGFNCITPLKPYLGPGYAEIVARLQRAVDQRYGLPPWTEKGYDDHKYADRLAAASEAHNVVGWRATALKKELGITSPPLDSDPLPALEGLKPWEPWPSYLAADTFLARLRELRKAMDQEQGAKGFRSAAE